MNRVKIKGKALKKYFWGEKSRIYLDVKIHFR